MNWAECLVESLGESQISLIAYVPDANIALPISLMEHDPFFHVVAATREEEAIGIAVGAYATGRNSAVFMQSSGFGNCINAIGSLCIPFRVPVPLFINLRGDLGEFNIAQVAMGRATRPILDILGLPHYTLNEGKGSGQDCQGGDRALLREPATPGPLPDTPAPWRQNCLDSMPPR